MQAKGNQGTWRKKRSRDHAQVRVAMGFDGLAAFHVPKPFENKGLWRQWKHANLCIDQGGDGLSMVHALGYLKDIQANCTPWYDPEHGQNRDVWLSIGECHLTSFFSWSCACSTYPMDLMSRTNASSRCGPS